MSKQHNGYTVPDYVDATDLPKAFTDFVDSLPPKQHVTAITVATAAPSGTAAEGDVWIQV
jgi:hypothetical protein